MKLRPGRKLSVFGFFNREKVFERLFSKSQTSARNGVSYIVSFVFFSKVLTTSPLPPPPAAVVPQVPRPPGGGWGPQVSGVPLQGDPGHQRPPLGEVDRHPRAGCACHQPLPLHYARGPTPKGPQRLD